MPNRFNQPNRAKTAEKTILISKHAETLRQHSTRRHKSALRYKIQIHASHRAKKQKTSFNPNFTRKLTEGARKTQKKYCVSRETLNILSINFSQTYRVSYCEKRELQKKTVNNIGFTAAMHDRKGKRPDKM